MLAGASYKFPLSPKGMVSGGFFGAVFGLVYGGVKYLLMKLANITEEELVQKKLEATWNRLE